MTENQLVEQKIDIRDFKRHFYEKYGRKLHIFIPPVDSSKITLDTLHVCTLAALYSDVPEYSHITTLLDRSRRKEYMIYVHNFCFIAWKMGYTKSRIGIYLKRNHATVINSCVRVSNGIDTKDMFTIDVYNKIINELKNYVGTVPENIKIKDDPKPAADTIWDQARRLLAIYE